MEVVENILDFGWSLLSVMLHLVNHSLVGILSSWILVYSLLFRKMYTYVDVFHPNVRFERDLELL